MGPSSPGASESTIEASDALPSLDVPQTRRLRLHSTALVVGLLLTASGCGSSDSISDSSVSTSVPAEDDVVAATAAPDTASIGEQRWSIEDAVYVLPAEIPAGWTLGVATQRVEQGEIPGGVVVGFGDYTILWVPQENAGRDRSNVDRDGPAFWINVGSRYYEDVYWPAFSDDSASSTLLIGEYSNATPIARDGDIAELVFRVDCCLVRLDARGISDDVVGSIAASMTALELDDWRSELGTRLLVDDQT